MPLVDFKPDWQGWRSLGLSPDTIFGDLDGARGVPEALHQQPDRVARRLGPRGGHRRARRLRAARFPYRFAWMRNKDISFFFLSQLILPPVVLAMPFLVLYKELALLDSLSGSSCVYTLMVLPIVIWIMRDQFIAIPVELEEAALVDGLSGLGRVLPDRRCRSRCPASSRPSSSPWCSAGTSTSSRRSSPAPREDPAGDGGKPDRDRRASAGGRWRRCRRRRSCRWSSSASSSNATSSRA